MPSGGSRTTVDSPGSQRALAKRRSGERSARRTRESVDSSVASSSIQTSGFWRRTARFSALTSRSAPIRPAIRSATGRSLPCWSGFAARLHPSLRWRTEVALPIDGDLRAWDAEIGGAPSDRWRARVEAETNIADGQALERRLALKLRDDPVGHLILLVSDTRANRRALATIRPGLAQLLPLGTRHLLTALSAGRDPGASGIIIL